MSSATPIGAGWSGTVPHRLRRKKESPHSRGSLWTLLVLICTALLLPGCSERGTERRASELPPLGAEEISGEVLWERIKQESSYPEYPYWPGHEGMQPGQAPHGPYHRIFINPRLHTALPIEERRVPHGGIIVKENYTGEQNLNSLTVMAKVEGYAPDKGNWFWAKYSPEGDIQAQGTPPPCISCHAGMRDNDYIIVHPLDAPVDE
jgi:hypothetical protein